MEEFCREHIAELEDHPKLRGYLEDCSESILDSVAAVEKTKVSDLTSMLEAVLHLRSQHVASCSIAVLVRCLQSLVLTNAYPLFLRPVSTTVKTNLRQTERFACTFSWYCK